MTENWCELKTIVDYFRIELIIQMLQVFLVTKYLIQVPERHVFGLLVVRGNCFHDVYFSSLL